MPSTESCTLGIQNKARIDNIEDNISKMESIIEEMRRELLTRPTQTMLKVVAIMSGALGAAVGTAVTLLVVLIKTLK